MEFLEEIMSLKKKEIALRKASMPVQKLRKSPLYHRQTVSLAGSLKNINDGGIIAEFKRKSPSRGYINRDARIADFVPAYQRAGAAGLSVLTDENYFGGSLNDLVEARALTSLPILRKDFIIDDYQLEEARSAGADVVLLISECLDKRSIRNLFGKACDMGLEVLVELHSSGELEKLPAGITLLGVNNRNLRTFNVDVNTSADLAGMVPEGLVLISESGISDPETIKNLRNIGYRGFLVGEHFMTSVDPEETCRTLVETIKDSHDH